MMMLLPSYLISPPETHRRRGCLERFSRRCCALDALSAHDLWRNRENVGRNVGFFNDRKLNLEVESLGVVMYLVTSGRYGGITLAVIDVGVQLWRFKNRKITLP